MEALARSDQNIPDSLLIVLFGTSFMDPGADQHLDCCVFRDLEASVYGRWMEELGGLRPTGIRSCEPA